MLLRRGSPGAAAALLMALGSAPALGVESDSRDDEIFGEPAASPAAAPSSPERPTASTTINPLLDSLVVGGRLEMRTSSAQEEQQKFPEAGFSRLKQADIYFDTRPNKDIRAFLRARFSEVSPTNPAVAAAAAGTAVCDPCVTTEIDELWFKWDYADTVFFTYGKQHLKWGSGRFWNPTDFTASDAKDPFALFDRRLGKELLKIHIPIEKQGFNYYAILQMDDADRNDDIGLALRGEFAFGGIGEAALSFQTRQDSPIRAGFDVSSGLGPIDVHVETAATKRVSTTRYEGEADVATGRLPQGTKDEDKTYVQSVGGLEYSYKYSDDDSVMVGGEYFHNELGYDDRELELYSLVNGDSRSLYAGRRYAGAYMRLPNPGSWNDSSFYLNGIRNLSDETAVLRFTAAWVLFKEATLEAYVSRCLGDYGEMCFRIPSSYKAFAASPAATPEQQKLFVALPTKRTVVTAGVGMSMNF